MKNYIRNKGKEFPSEMMGLINTNLIKLGVSMVNL